MEQVQAVDQRHVEQPPEAERRIPMSYAEFLDSFDDSTHAEWVNGEAIVFMPPNIRHQDIVIFLLALIDGFAKVFSLGKTLIAPCEMRLELSGTSREPDVMFIATANSARLSEQRLNGPADLVIEVISESSISRDRAEKFYEYQINGVREYWIIDPRHGVARADFWVLDEDGRYRPVPINADGIYHSTVLPNFRLDVRSLLSDSLPSPLKALTDMVGVDTLLRSLGHGN